MQVGFYCDFLILNFNHHNGEKKFQMIYFHYYVEESLN